MKLINFDSYEEYKEAQIKGSKRRRRQPAFWKSEIYAIGAYHKKLTKKKRSLQIICHGARCGKEVKCLARRFKGSFTIGTDLNPHRTNCVIEWDFNFSKPEWQEAFDIVYSNSLDHSNDPAFTMKVWTSQLKPNGVMYIRWSADHALPQMKQTPLPGGDCFGGDFTDYVTLIREAGCTIKNVLWFENDRRANLFSLVFCAQKKET